MKYKINSRIKITIEVENLLAYCLNCCDKRKRDDHMDQHGVIATVGTVNVSAKTSAVWNMIFAKSPSCVCVFAINSL